jgi:hypothetical protein
MKTFTAVLVMCGLILGAEAEPPANPSLVLRAKTNKTSQQNAAHYYGFTKLSLDNQSASVAVSVRFFQKPITPYQVQCFFISRNEKSSERAIFDAKSHTSQDVATEGNFLSQQIFGGNRSFATMLISAVDDGSAPTHKAGSVTTNDGNHIEGWIVRVVSDGKVLRIESNQQQLADLATKIPNQLDAAAVKATSELK